jgi:peptidoglycan/xylan/chitin deacetylase (PgdA/CDA1 family)
MRQVLYKTFAKLRGDRLAWRVPLKRLRILCYHGICDDNLAGEPWIPDYFVTAGEFERQLQYLKDNAHVLSLTEGVARLQEGTLPSGAVSITFDDGYANNLSLAYPLLRKYQIPATIFLSTAYMESGELFPFLRLQLIGLARGNQEGRAPAYKSDPLDRVLNWAGDRWRSVKEALTEDQLRTLRPLTVAEVKAADPTLIEFGAHSHTHCIFRNETPDRRRDEIRSSIQNLSRWNGGPVQLFSYPNGERGDFGEIDKQALRACGIEAAVTGIGGSNGKRTDLLELRRYPVGMHHGVTGFRAEVSGLRSFVLAASRGFRA